MDMSQSLEAGYEHSNARVDAVNKKMEATTLIPMAEPSEEMKAAQQKLDILRKEVSDIMHSFSYLDCLTHTHMCQHVCVSEAVSACTPLLVLNIVERSKMCVRS